MVFPLPLARDVTPSVPSVDVCGREEEREPEEKEKKRGRVGRGRP